MLKINLITVGKLKEEYWRAAESEYLKRLKPYAEINIREIREETFNEKIPVDLVKEKEAEKILSEAEKIKDSYFIVLDANGKSVDSLKFAENLDKWNTERSSVTFIIGGPLGLNDKVKEKANFVFSLSSLTFTHQMARIFLIEQIYRASMIRANRSYHY